MKISLQLPLLLQLLSSCSCDVRNLLRRQRSLVYPDPGGSETKVQVLFGLGLPMEGEISITLGYVLKCNYNLPYNASSYSHPGSEENRFSGGSRWSLYRILEHVLDKSCLLRSVCEAAELPFSLVKPGLLGQLLQALLAPSMTGEEYEIYADREYHAAEARGRNHDCRLFYRDCPRSPLDYFTRVGRF